MRPLLFLTTLVVSASVVLAADYRDASLPVDQRVEDLVSKMTTAEKIGQLRQEVFDVFGPDNSIQKFVPDAIAGQYGSYILMCEDPKFRNALQKVSVEQSRLGIPILFGGDVIHGHRTIFPVPLGMAAAWNPPMLQKAQAIAAKEARAMGLNWTFAPMCDLARDARWGRVAETGGEDPYLNSLYVAASVHGFQGANPADPGQLVACLKHFAGYSASIGGRDYNHTEIPNWTFRNFHLPPFHAGVDAGALTVMSSFNANDGIPSTASKFLLTDLLRGEWGFNGFVVSDWEGVLETINWGYAANDAEAARLCLEAGNNMEMVSKTYPGLAPQVESGKIPTPVLDDAVRRVLRVKFLAGLFENPYVDEGLYSTTILAPDSLALARQAVSKSAVLLKNKGVLPISPQMKKIALIGPFADDAREMLGCWISQGKPKDVVTLAAALKSRLAGPMQLQVVQGCDINGNLPRMKTLTDGTTVVDSSVPPPLGVFDLPSAVKAANDSDVVIVTLGEPWYWTGENASRARIGLTGRQQELFETLVAVGKPIVVVLFCGRPLAVPELFEDAAAVLVAWQPGVQAGPGLADVLFGDTSPSGRLTISWPRDTGQCPIYYNRYNTGRPQADFINYRDLSRDPLFPFGFGLTYTNFEYGKVEIVPAAMDKPAMARVTVKNTGKREGDEVAQLYIRQMVCAEGARPYQELRGFQHLILRSGESKQVSFALDDNVLGYVDREGKWRVDPGAFNVWIAPSAGVGDPAPYTRP